MADEDHPSRLTSDPHAWQDPRKVIDYVRNIASAIVSTCGRPASLKFVMQHGGVISLP